VKGVAVAATFLAGCTFLVSFDDVPGDDAAAPMTTSRPPDVNVTDSGPDQRAPAPDASDGPEGGADYSAVCTGLPDGKYCNGNQIVVDAGSKDDLITCLNGKAVSVKLCPKGSGCQRMVSGYPDECDECEGRANGQYCGDDFPGWHPLNARARIRCDNGAIVGSLICANQCTGTGPGATCQ
jgi:hypothetical protein